MTQNHLWKTLLQQWEPRSLLEHMVSEQLEQRKLLERIVMQQWKFMFAAVGTDTIVGIRGCDGGNRGNCYNSRDRGHCWFTAVT
jgi:hypothetical protein